MAGRSMAYTEQFALPREEWNQLDRSRLFTIQGWAKRKVRDQRHAIASINATRAMMEDQRLLDMLRIEQNALSHLFKRLPIEDQIDEDMDFVPEKVDSLWAQRRRDELHRQLTHFATYCVMWVMSEGENRRLANSFCLLLHNQWQGYNRMSTGDWVGPMQAFEAYVASLEHMQLFLRNANYYNPRCFAGKAIRKVRTDLVTAHNACRDEVYNRSLAIRIRPWQGDTEFRDHNAMTWEEFESLEDDYWDEKGSGPPLILDYASFIELCQAADLEDLATSRREDIDKMMREYRGKRYVLVHKYLRRERVVWGRVLMQVAQWKRHNEWFGPHGYGHPRKVEEANAN